ncbi:MAG: energy transducer TonB [Gammaproteobacteria bacterium]
MKKLLWIILFSGILTLSSALAQSKAGIQTHPDHAAPPEKTCDESELLKARMHKAIYDAIKYPPNALYTSWKGVVAVKFNYLNGHVKNARIIASSGTGILDRAAMRAVKSAKYPPAPSAFQNRQVSDIVYIIFDNTGILSRSDDQPDSEKAFSKQLAMDSKCEVPPQSQEKRP